MVALANGNDATIQPCQRLRSTRVVPCQAAQAVDPTNAAGNHPTARQQDKASFCVFPRLMTCNNLPSSRDAGFASWPSYPSTTQASVTLSPLPCGTSCARERTRAPSCPLAAVPLTPSRCPCGSPPRWTVLPCDLPQALRSASTRVVMHGVTHTATASVVSLPILACIAGIVIAGTRTTFAARTRYAASKMKLRSCPAQRAG